MTERSLDWDTTCKFCGRTLTAGTPVVTVAPTISRMESLDTMQPRRKKRTSGGFQTTGGIRYAHPKGKCPTLRPDLAYARERRKPPL